MAIESEMIHAAYRKYLLRDADQDGLRHYTTCSSIEQVELALVNSDEFRRNQALVRLPKCVNAWKICILEEAKVVYVPIAKNAHTSIMAALYEFRGIDWRTLPISEQAIADSADDDLKMHTALRENKSGFLAKDYSPSFVDSVLRDDEYLKLVVFRDPVDRFLSSYNHLFVQEAGNPIARRHTEPVLEALGIKADARTILPLPIFAKYVSTTRSVDLDPHWAPQYTFIEGIKIDHVIPIERLDLLGKIIAARSGCSLNVAGRNVRPHARGLRAADENGEALRLIEESYWIDSHIYKNAQEKVAELDATYS